MNVVSQIPRLLFFLQAVIVLLFGGCSETGYLALWLLSLFALFDIGLNTVLIKRNNLLKAWGMIGVFLVQPILAVLAAFLWGALRGPALKGQISLSPPPRASRGLPSSEQISSPPTPTNAPSGDGKR